MWWQVRAPFLLASLHLRRGWEYAEHSADRRRGSGLAPSPLRTWRAFVCTAASGGAGPHPACCLPCLQWSCCRRSSGGGPPTSCPPPRRAAMGQGQERRRLQRRRWMARTSRRQAAACPPSPCTTWPGGQCACDSARAANMRSPLLPPALPIAHHTTWPPPQVDPGEHYGEDAAAAGGGDKRPTGGWPRQLAARLCGWPRSRAEGALARPAAACCASCSALLRCNACAPTPPHSTPSPSFRCAAGKVVGIIKRNWRTRGYCGSLQVGALLYPLRHDAGPGQHCPTTHTPAALNGAAAAC